MRCAGAHIRKHLGRQLGRQARLRVDAWRTEIDEGVLAQRLTSRQQGEPERAKVGVEAEDRLDGQTSRQDSRGGIGQAQRDLGELLPEREGLVLRRGVDLEYPQEPGLLGLGDRVSSMTSLDVTNRVPSSASEA